MGEEFRLQVGMRQLMEFFAVHHLPAELAVRAYKLYGDSTVELLYDDPYLLMAEGLDAPFGAVAVSYTHLEKSRLADAMSAMVE